MTEEFLAPVAQLVPAVHPAPVDLQALQVVGELQDRQVLLGLVVLRVPLAVVEVQDLVVLKVLQGLQDQAEEQVPAVLQALKEQEALQAVQDLRGQADQVELLDLLDLAVLKAQEGM